MTYVQYDGIFQNMFTSILVFFTFSELTQKCTDLNEKFCDMILQKYSFHPLHAPSRALCITFWLFCEGNYRNIISSDPSKSHQQSAEYGGNVVKLQLALAR